jgi:hypothetical protein
MADESDALTAAVNQPHSHYAHVYAVVRHDAFHSQDTPPQVTVTVTKVFGDQDQAQREVERLNLLQQQRGVEAHYWMQITRFVPSTP